MIYRYRPLDCLALSVSSLLAAALVGRAADPAAAGTAAAGAEHPIVVTYQPFGQGGDGENPQEFVDSIDATPAYSARLLRPPAGLDWRTLPADVKPGEWISLVKAKFGRQCDFLAFVFADADGTVAFAARRPSRTRQVQYWFSVPPGNDQIPMNAIRETATDFIFRYGLPPRAVRPRLHMLVKPWEEKKAAQDLLTADGQMAAGPSGKLDNPNSMEALAFAAAYEAGWQPTAGEAYAALTLEYRPAMSLYYALRVTAKAKTAAPVLTRNNVSKEFIYPHLVRLFRRYLDGAGYRDFGYLGSDTSRVLAWADGAAVVRDGSLLKAIETATGKSRWVLDPKKMNEVRVTREYTVRAAPGSGGVTLYRYDNAIARIDITNGTAQVLAPLGAQGPSGFDVAADGAVAVAASNTLHLFRRGALAATFAPDGCVAGPAYGADGLFIGGRSGTVYRLQPANLGIVWQTPLAQSLDDRLCVCGDLVLAATEDTLFALDAATGKVRWKLALGDVLLAPPQLGKNGLVVASKSNRIWLLDPASGTVRATAAWPTWLTGVTLVETRAGAWVCCTDLRNRLSLLNAGDLKPAAEYTLPAAPQPDVVYAPDAPLVWLDEPLQNTEDTLDLMLGNVGDKAPALLAGDQSGFVYLVPLPPSK